ncbi:MAG: hypothetical protein KDC00_09905 [Flavobacteriales bacterium]|nr:hypothetical protein [Flavobacteriales bacterium]
MIIHGGRSRLAPTPSGYLHAGNAFNFLVTALLAEHFSSTLVLRIDDIDAERIRPEYVEDIFRSMEWLGIRADDGPSGPEELYRTWSQVHRMPRYVELFDALKRQGHLYPCVCSRAEMAERVSRCAPHSCRTDPPAQVPGGTPWRLSIPRPCPSTLLDLQGRVDEHNLAVMMEDPIVLVRGTGRPAYQLVSLMDDVDMDITFIVRGADLLPSSVCQSHMAERAGLEAFREVRFLHHPLTTGPDGRKLSKSAGASSLCAMRESGGSPDVLRQEAERYVDELLGSFNA